MNVVFLGPTLSPDVARGLCDAVFLPPARRGDVLAATLRFRPTTIALIDGYFEQVPAVWHKELLFALAKGIRVAGAASMGALRAAELHSFGMIGVGRVFEAYVAGRFLPFPEPFMADDEVAVAHGPAELGYPATEAMVDIRATLAAAIEAGVLELEPALAVAAVAKGLFYKERSWTEVLARATQAGLDPRALQVWLPTGRVLQKRRDAEALLCGIAAGTLVADPPVFRFERTLIWEEALGCEEALGWEEARGQQAAGTGNP